MEQYERDFKGIFIPREIWLDNRLSALDKMIYAEIDSLTHLDKGCIASNEYIADFCKCSERKVSEAINKLIAFGLIEVESFDGRSRILRGRVAESARQGSRICEADSQNLLGSLYIENNSKSNIGDNTHASGESCTSVTASHKAKHPTVDDVNLYIKQRASATGMKEEDICNAEFFVDYYTSGDWKDSKGNPVKNWKQKIVSVWEGKSWWKSAKNYTTSTEPVKISKSFKESCQRLGLHWDASYSRIAAEVKELRRWYCDKVADDTFLAKNQRSSWGGLCMYIESFWDSYLTYVSDVIGTEPPQPAFFKVDGNMFNSWCRSMEITL